MSDAAGPVRVMVVDDSVVARGLVARWVAAEEGFEVVATAPDGRAALLGLESAAPDIVLLDLDMPVLDGMATLPRLLRARPDLSVVIVSTLTQRNAELSLRCLAAGAVDYLPKPSGHRHLTVSETFRSDLVAKLRMLAVRHRHGVRPEAGTLPSGGPRGGRDGGSGRPAALLLGASTGGPRAVIALLRALGETGVASRLPVLLVQHMPPIFTTVFAAQIAAEARLPTAEATDGEAVLPGRVYLAPGGRHMGLASAGGAVRIRIDDGPPLRHCRPAVDVLLRDAAATYGAGALAVVLTGMGQDGLDGAFAVAAARGTVLVQDEASSVVWGMPGAIAKAGLAREVLALADLPAAIERRVVAQDPLRRAAESRVVA